jgi:transcriptional regulator with XRE-family HTH domain
MNRLRHHRESRGLSLQAVATGSSCSAEYVRRLEVGFHAPSLEVARRIAAFFGLTVDDLFPAAGNLVVDAPSRGRKRVA